VVYLYYYFPLLLRYYAQQAAWTGLLNFIKRLPYLWINQKISPFRWILILR